MRGQTAWRDLRFPPVKAGLECSSTERGGGLNTDPLAWHWVTEQPFSKVTLGVRLTPAAVWSQNDRSYKRRQVVHEVGDKKCLMVLSLDGWYQTRVFSLAGDTIRWNAEGFFTHECMKVSVVAMERRGFHDAGICQRSSVTAAILCLMSPIRRRTLRF